MKFIYRIGIGLIVCSAVACSKNDADNAAPVAEPETVIIGCAGATGADVDVRTELEGDLSVRWAEGDEIRLWARESGATEFLTGVQNVPFRFDYYSPSWSRAGFAGTISGVESTFDTKKKYDYFAVSPAPASDAAVVPEFDADGKLTKLPVTYTIPAEQTGEFDGRYDIMTAEPLRDAAGLQAGDDNPSIKLEFNRHHVHVLKIEIGKNSLETRQSPGVEESIRSIELTFPDPVVGQLTVDATGKNDPLFTPAEGDKGKVLTLRFNEPKKAGDVVYAFIARQEPLSSDDGKVIIKATGASGGDKPCVSLERSFTKEHEFTRGAVTTLKYDIPERYRCTKIFFSLGEKEGGDTRTVPISVVAENGYGWGTLGEEIKSFQIVDKDGNALPKCSSFTCDHVKNEYEISFLLEDEAERVKFFQCASEGCTVKLTSDRAVVECPFKLSSLEAEVENRVPAFKVPYLFEEDFNSINQDFEYHSEYKDSDAHNPAAISLAPYGLSSWSGTRVGGANGLNLRIVSRTEIGFWVKEDYNGRVDSAPIGTCLIEGKTPPVVVRYEYGGDRYNGVSEQTGNPLVTFGYTNTDNEIISLNENMTDKFLSDKEIKLDMNSNNNNEKYYGITPHCTEKYTIPSCQQNTRLSWKVSNNHQLEFGANGMYWLYIDNIKVQLASEQ